MSAPETTHVMLDLETMGTRPGAIIRAVGAVKFTVTGGILDRMYFRVTSQSCERLGMHFDADTVQWWMAQDEGARLELLREGGEITNVLAALRYFCLDDLGKDGKLNVWGCGASFDPALLEFAYRASGQLMPWAHPHVRCYRTLKALFPDVRNREKVAHHALKDAEWQAEHTVSVLRALAKLEAMTDFGARENGVDAVPGGGANSGSATELPYSPAPVHPSAGSGSPTGPQNFREKEPLINADERKFEDGRTPVPIV